LGDAAQGTDFTRRAEFVLRFADDGLLLQILHLRNIAEVAETSSRFAWHNEEPTPSDLAAPARTDYAGQRFLTVYKEAHIRFRR